VICLGYLFAFQALGFLLDVITLKHFSADFMNQIIKHKMSKIFELAMAAEDGHVARQQAMGFIRAVTNSDVFKENVDMRFVNSIIYHLYNKL
jgi:hypothetical protein